VLECGGGVGPAPNGLVKNAGCGWCHSAPGLILPHRELPIGGRGEPNGAAGAPHGAAPVPTAERCGLGLPHPWPTGAGMPVRRGGAITSSSSAESAEEPNLPLGLGERRLGDPEPEPDAVEDSPAGRAMGAMGRATGPGSPMDARFVGLGFIICVGEFKEVPGAPGVFEGGPMG